ncbi:non-hydrolyzing UDP-N-acetylglucosamine 2-epimerase [Desulfitibacter alkalitolerans]|uniref:non-hydrolyzing UDP-N-acetylglucosamine 2-epimerase n=1 Tax=Desulfitibacter alkalitolerans TaxID=264641 RepID=UPI0004813F64|nr:UDP-N-acetylglucosamine 2-epimerase (non-hydrolyzing) [Desulfitibacter alkalitolerans]
MLKVISIFGTRPEAIKMAPLVKKLSKESDILSKVVVTAQHRQMLDQVLELFDISPDYDLDIMQQGQTLTGVTVRVLSGLEEIIQKEKPHMVLVHGDTTTTFSSALAAFYQQAAVGHVEAGLRTFNKYSPYPEEMNRRLTGAITDLHFAPTQTSMDNLLKENIPREKIIVTGNTVIDALLETAAKDYPLETLLPGVDWSKRILLLTAHRRENWGEPLGNIFLAARELVRDFPDTELIFPVHKNPRVSQLANEVLANTERIHLIEPLDYLPFVTLMNRSYLVLTDSGGMQEEAPSLGKPVLVLRETTERPEAVEAGTVKMVGTARDKLYQVGAELLENHLAYREMAHAVNPYGDGKASGRIIDAIKRHFA